MNHDKMTLAAFIDEEPMKHQATCECGFKTDKDADFAKVMAAINKHNGKA